MPENTESKERKLITIETALKARYQSRRRITQPSYVSGPKNDLNFQRAADKVLDLGADPEQFVDALFNSWAGEHPPSPANLASPQAVEAFEKLEVEERCPPELEFEAQKRYLTNYVKRAKLTKDEVFLAPWTNLRSYFRCLFCSDQIRDDVLFMYGKVGRAQIEEDTSLKKYLEKLCPKNLDRFLEPPCYHIPEAVDEELPAATSVENSWENQPEPVRLCR